MSASGDTRYDKALAVLDKFLARDPHNDYNAIGRLYQYVMRHWRTPELDPDHETERRVVNAVHLMWMRYGPLWGRARRREGFMVCFSLVCKFFFDDWELEHGYGICADAEVQVLRLLDWNMTPICRFEPEN